MRCIKSVVERHKDIDVCYSKKGADIFCFSINYKLLNDKFTFKNSAVIKKLRFVKLSDNLLN